MSINDKQLTPPSHDIDKQQALEHDYTVAWRGRCT